MSPLGADVVAAEVGQPLQVADGASSESPLGEICQLVDSMDIVTESDNGCTVDSSIWCNKIHSKSEPVDDLAVSKWIQSVIGTHSALREAHTIDILVDTVNELAPTTNWVHVMENEGFNIDDKSAWNLMMSIYARAFKESSAIDVCSSLWKNIEGQNRLMKFVDMCQKLKILSDVLNSAPFPFKIKVAAAASRKYRSLIESWLSEKSSAYKGHFLEECVNLLKEIMSNTLKKQPQSDVMNMNWGSLPLFVEICQSHTGELLHNQILEEQVTELTLKLLLQVDSFNMIKNHVVMLENERQFNKDLIIEEERKFCELKERAFERPFAHCQPDLFEEEYGPFIQKLKTLIKSNDETLKYLRKGFLQFFPRLDDIYRRNKAASKKAGPMISHYYDYQSRGNIEMLWLDGMEQQVDRFLSRCAPILAELEDAEIHICDTNKRVALLSKECIENFDSGCQALDRLAKLWGDVGMLWKKLAVLTKAVKDMCLTSKNLRILLNEKLINATRFHNIEQLLKEEKESLKVCQELVDLEVEVEQARIYCRRKKYEVSETSMEYERIMSWRSRLLQKRNILGEMRIQGRDMCAFVSTVVMRESLGKREDSLYRLRAGRRYRPSRPFIKLSEHHLQDIVRDFFAKNIRKGSEKLDVCMERMRETGVVSERTYDRADEYEMKFDRYKISSFEKMDPSNLDEAFQKLDAAIVLVGTFGITKGYYSLQPGEVYDVPPDAVWETNPAGNKLTHAVVIVGYGRTPQGRPFYAFQNWYGPTWGKDGFGMVTCRSIKQLYSAKL